MPVWGGTPGGGGSETAPPIPENTVVGRPEGAGEGDRVPLPLGTYLTTSEAGQLDVAGAGLTPFIVQSLAAARSHRSVRNPENYLPEAQELAALPTGYLRNETGTGVLSSREDQLTIKSPSGVVDETQWRVSTGSNQFRIETLNDAGQSISMPVWITRTGGFASQINLGVLTSVNQTGGLPMLQIKGTSQQAMVRVQSSIRNWLLGIGIAGDVTAGDFKLRDETSGNVRLTVAAADGAVVASGPVQTSATGTAAAPAITTGPTGGSGGNGMWWDASAPGWLKFSAQGRPQLAIRHDVDLNLVQVLDTWNTAGGGSRFTVGRNFNGAGAAGTLVLTQRDAGAYLMWVHNGQLRIGTAAPTVNDSTAHTSGTVIGDQTSMLAAKDVLHERTDVGAMLETVTQTKVYDFTYKDGRYNGETFTGAVTDDAPWLGKDFNRALNEVNGFGYLIGAIKALVARVRALEARLAAKT